MSYASGSGSGSRSAQPQQVRQQVDEVVGIMQQNIQKVVERGENLEALEQKTDTLQQSSLQFNRTATRVKRNMWWKNMKLTVILVIIVLIIVGAIIGGVVGSQKSEKS